MISRILPDELRRLATRNLMEHIPTVTPTFQTRKEPYIIIRSYWNTLTDTAILLLQPLNLGAAKHDWSRPYLKLAPPHVGDGVRAFGFPSSKFAIQDSGRASVVLNPIITSGVVRDVHHLMRDRGKYPFPCFQVNARFDGGMSGGPVFDDVGNVCGLVCGSLPPYAPGEEHVSYVATLWPFLSIVMDAPMAPWFPPGANYPMWELAQNGTVQVTNLDDFLIVIGRDGVGSIDAYYDISKYPPSPNG